MSCARSSGTDGSSLFRDHLTGGVLTWEDRKLSSRCSSTEAEKRHKAVIAINRKLWNHFRFVLNRSALWDFQLLPGILPAVFNQVARECLYVRASTDTNHKRTQKGQSRPRKLGSHLLQSYRRVNVSIGLLLLLEDGHKNSHAYGR